MNPILARYLKTLVVSISDIFDALVAALADPASNQTSKIWAP